MSDQHTNVDILKTAYETWHQTKGGSIDHWMALMAEDVDFRSLAEGAERLEFTRRRSSKADVEGYMNGLVDQFEMIHYTVDEYIADGDRIVALGSTAWRNRTTGKEFDTPKADVIRMRDGRIIEFFELYDTAMTLATSEPAARAIVEASYDARRREAVDETLSFFADDATFRIVADPSFGMIGQRLQGHDQLRAAFEEIFRTWDWTDFPIRRLVIDGENVVAHCGGRMRHTPSGQEVEYETLDMLTLKDGKITEFVEFLDTQKLGQVLASAG